MEDPFVWQNRIISHFVVCRRLGQENVLCRNVTLGARSHLQCVLSLNRLLMNAEHMVEKVQIGLKWPYNWPKHFFLSFSFFPPVQN